MKRLAIILSLLFTTCIYSQFSNEIEIKNFPRSDKAKIQNVLTDFEMALNSGNETAARGFINTYIDAKNNSKDDSDNSLVIDFDKFTTSDSSLCKIDIRYDSLIIKGNKAFAEVEFVIYSNFNTKKQIYQLSFVKNGNDWRISPSKFIGRLIEYYTLETRELRAPKLVSYDWINNNPLIPVPHFKNIWTGETFWDINKSVAEQNFGGKQFISNLNETDMALVFKPNADSINDAAGFITDTKWQRLLYLDLTESLLSRTIRELNRNQIQLNKWHVIGATTVHNNTNSKYELYVVTCLPAAISKLHYNFETKQLINIENYYGSDDAYYTDISSIKERGTANPAKLFITDPYKKTICVFGLDGVKYQDITGYYLNGNFKEFSHVFRLEILDAGTPLIAIADDRGQKIIIGYLDYEGGNNYSIRAYKEYVFQSDSKVVDVGIDVDGNYLFPDLYKNRVHKFNRYGEYLCSFENSQWFSSPVRISNISFTNIEHMYTSVYIANKWGDTHGFRRFWPGTDVMDLSFTQHNYETLEFNYRLLSESVGKVEILQNGSVVHTFSTPFVWSAGYYSETLDYSNLSPGSYQFRVTAKHWLDNQYKEYSQGFRIKTINFTVSPIPVPLIDHFVQDPKPICRGGTGRIIVYLRNENSTDYGDLKYYWSASNLPQDVELVQVPNYDKKYCTLVYHNTKLNSVNGDPIPPATITCTVTNQTGSDREEFSPIYFSTACSGGVECPTLSFTENDSMFTDNTLLIGSPDNPGVDIEDYYMVNERIKPQHKEVSFRIHEPEIAHTWLDNVDLLQVKAKPNENIAVTPEGEIISYKLPNKPFTIILNDSIDVTAILADRDDNSYTFENGDVLKLILGNKYKAGTTSYVVVDAYKPPPKEQEFAEIKTKYNKQAPGFNGIEDKDFGLFNLRPYKSTVCKKLDSALGDTLLVEILQYGTIDLFTIAADEQTARVNELGLVSAVHSTYGDVKNALTSTDETYSEILPGEGIDIKFATPNNGIGNFRYILHVTGRYTEGDSMFIAKQTAGENRGLIPEKTELVGAYPNPFNPSTTIEYTLKKDSPVTLKVYDILGSEVATLVNREEPAGRYSVIFNAAAINGGLPSGVYIYRFQAGEYSDVKKMLLVK